LKNQYKYAGSYGTAHFRMVSECPRWYVEYSCPGYMDRLELIVDAFFSDDWCDATFHEHSRDLHEVFCSGQNSNVSGFVVAIPHANPHTLGFSREWERSINLSGIRVAVSESELADAITVLWKDRYSFSSFQNPFSSDPRRSLQGHALIKYTALFKLLESSA
jgi:hypothetical protein